jgi:LCP family protein required for cell wall assembly
MGSRSIHARHARHRPARTGRRVLAISLAAVAVVVLAFVGVAGFTAWSLTAELKDGSVALADEPTQPPALGAYEGAFDVLITGTDECEDELRASLGARCTGADAEGVRNDVNLLVHVSAEPRRVTVVSFPRDLQLPVPACTAEDGSTTAESRKQPINSTFATGGLACVADTVSDLSGQSIPFAAKVSFGNVVNITDALGGVEVCIGNNGMRDRETGIDWEPGPRVIRGMEALQFLRTRHGVGDGSDLARIGNQQQYLSRLLNKVRSDDVLTNPTTLLSLASTAARNVQPSESLADPIRMAQLALALKDVPQSDIAFVQYPVLDDPDDPNRVVPDTSAAAVLWDALARNVPVDLTGDAGSNGGVLDVPGTPEAPTAPATPDGSATGTPPPVDETVALPDNINGITADQETCSAGRGR